MRRNKQQSIVLEKSWRKSGNLPIPPKEKFCPNTLRSSSSTSRHTSSGQNDVANRVVSFLKPRLLRMTSRERANWKEVTIPGKTDLAMFITLITDEGEVWAVPSSSWENAASIVKAWKDLFLGIMVKVFSSIQIYIVTVGLFKTIIKNMDWGGVVVYRHIISRLNFNLFLYSTVAVITVFFLIYVFNHTLCLRM